MYRDIGDRCLGTSETFWGGLAEGLVVLSWVEGQCAQLRSVEAVAITATDMTVVPDDVGAIPDAIGLARVTLVTIRAT